MQRRPAAKANSLCVLRKELFSSSGALVVVFIFSAAINILMFAGPVFMLQVYDRVLASRSSATLVVLFVIVAVLYGLMGVLDHFRGRVLARVGAGFQAALDSRVFRLVLREATSPAVRDKPASALRDLASIQAALSSPGAGALFDLPWAPLFIAFLFVFHPWIGWFALSSVTIVLSLAVINQLCTQKLQVEAAQLIVQSEAHTESTRKSIETVRGLGMVGVMSRKWQSLRDAALTATISATDKSGAISAATRTVRLLLQSAILGLGALLVLQDQLSAGAMMASSILLGRALAPIEQIVAHWSQFQRARSGWTELSRLLGSQEARTPSTKLPRPEARLDVQNLMLAAPGENQLILQGVTFSAGPGDAIAVIGASASGKSCLAKAVIGLWTPANGEVRLGGAGLNQYEADQLGQYFGYLPQEIDLFSGTIAQNIGRFDPSATSDQIIAAAQSAEAHDMIKGLPEGYDTQIAEGAGRLSGGQRQRIALSRAFYGDPLVLVLDEPNSSLDEPGILALNRAISTARKAGKIALVMSHRPSVLAECNKVIALESGRMRSFGPRDEVLSRVLQTVPRIDANGVRAAS